MLRVGFVLRSTEIQPVCFRFVSPTGAVHNLTHPAAAFPHGGGASQNFLGGLPKWCGGLGTLAKIWGRADRAGLTPGGGYHFFGVGDPGDAWGGYHWPAVSACVRVVSGLCHLTTWDSLERTIALKALTKFSRVGGMGGGLPKWCGGLGTLAKIWDVRTWRD